MKHFRWRSSTFKKWFGYTELIGYHKVDLWFFYMLIPKRKKGGDEDRRPC